MDQAAIEGIGAELSESFGVLVAGRELPDKRTTFRIVGVPLHPDCTPKATDVLVAFGAQGAAPEVYVRQGIKLKGGREPKNTYPETIEGELWMRFSTDLAYDPAKPLAFYVYGKLGRFTRAE
jgi:hypothetical protein